MTKTQTIIMLRKEIQMLKQNLDSANRTITLKDDFMRRQAAKAIDFQERHGYLSVHLDVISNDFEGLLEYLKLERDSVESTQFKKKT